jgi:hypothetical protein
MRILDPRNSVVGQALLRAYRKRGDDDSTALQRLQQIPGLQMQGGNVVCSPAALASVVKAAKRDAVKNALKNVASKQVTGYYSTVRFGTILDGAGHTIIPSGQRLAFNYKVGDNMVIAGFPDGTIATLRHTNLSEAGKTRDGEKYSISGIALHKGPQSDDGLAQAVWNDAFFQLTMNSGTDTWPLGYLGFFPAISGLSGSGTNRFETPDLSSSFNTISVQQNGQQEDTNYFAFPDGEELTWNASGNTDGSLVMPFTLAQDIDLGILVPRVAGPGVSAWTPPAPGDPYSFVDITVRLLGSSIASLSVNR